MLADIVAEEGENAVGALDAREDVRAVAARELGGGEVGGDDGLFVRHQTRVDDLVEGTADELGGQLGAEIVDDEQVAAEKAGDVLVRAAGLVAGEFLRLEALEDVGGGVVDNGVARLADDACDGTLEDVLDDEPGVVLDRAFDGLFNPREAFGSHSDSDHVYNTPRAWAMQRFLSPHDEEWDGPNATCRPEDDDIPWCR
ncbi:MAG: C69 family dipeptidase, partial [Firmicutes bacterium]|nr:C69 family dipeptidase [Bacillota bacterium]